MGSTCDAGNCRLSREVARPLSAAEEPRLDPAFTRVLARAYTFKEVTDYGIGSQAAVSVADAEEMIRIATTFVDRMAEILA